MNVSRLSFWDENEAEETSGIDVAIENSGPNVDMDRQVECAKRHSTKQKKTYFVRHLDSGAIKIGRSADPPTRLRKLKKVFGGRMELLGWIPEHMAETCLIGYLKKWSLGSEWFKPSNQVTQVVDTCLTRGYSEGLRLARYLAFATDGDVEVR